MGDQQKYINKLNGDRVLIIGGSSGIGYAVAEACIEYGCVVIISASSQAKATKAHDSLRKAYPSATDRITSLSCDLAEANDLEANIAGLFQEVSKTGPLDHIVFTAGDELVQIPITSVTLSVAQQAGLVRFFAPLLVAKHASSHINPGPKSSITLTSGVGSHKMGSGGSIAGAYAAGLQGMTRALAVDMQPIRGNVVAPGPTDTPLWRMPSQHKQEVIEFLKTKLTTGQIGSPENVVETYLGVLRDWNCTGAVLSTNGGYLLL